MYDVFPRKILSRGDFAIATNSLPTYNAQSTKRQVLDFIYQYIHDSPTLKSIHMAINSKMMPSVV